MSDCGCHHPPFNYQDYTSKFIGTDKTNWRYGEVYVKHCVHCGSQWLEYIVEYEGYSGSGRWFCAPISDEALATLTPEQAVPFLEQQPWHFVGGSYFGTRGALATGPGPIQADL